MFSSQTFWLLLVATAALQGGRWLLVKLLVARQQLPMTVVNTASTQHIEDSILTIYYKHLN